MECAIFRYNNLVKYYEYIGDQKTNVNKNNYTQIYKCACLQYDIDYSLDFKSKYCLLNFG